MHTATCRGWTTGGEGAINGCLAGQFAMFLSDISTIFAAHKQRPMSF